MLCAVHNKEMRTNRRGLYCPTPIGKDASGQTLWCQWKPGMGTAETIARPSSAKTIDEYENTPEAQGYETEQSFNGAPLHDKKAAEKKYWEGIGREKALCGMVNARLQTQSPAQVLLEIEDITRLLGHIEAVAKK